MERRTDPTVEDLKNPTFNAIWNVIKHWDIRRTPDSHEEHLYSYATGTDVMKIMNVLRDSATIKLLEKTVRGILYIKNCPFCESKPSISFVDYGEGAERHWMQDAGMYSNGWIIECPNSGCLFQRIRPMAFIHEVVEGWNNRK